MLLEKFTPTQILFYSARFTPGTTVLRHSRRNVLRELGNNLLSPINNLKYVTYVKVVGKIVVIL